MDKINVAGERRPRKALRMLSGLPLAVLLGTASSCSMMGSFARNAATSSATQDAVIGAASATQTAVVGAYNQYEAMKQSMALIGLFGMVSAHSSLNAGEYVQYRVPAGTVAGIRAGTVEWASLGTDVQDNPWWRFKFIDAQSSETSTLEFAMSKPGEMTQMRHKFPMDKDVVIDNVPALKGTTSRPTEPAKAQPAKAVIADTVRMVDHGIENIAVPAGTFSATHISYVSDRVTSDFWSTDSVPGRSVKIKHAYVTNEGGAPTEAVIELAGFGTGATSELGVLLRK